MSTGKEYRATKKIMLGKTTMNPDFVILANFIDITFGVKTINIIYDTFDKDKRPRLNICFEFEHEKLSFCTKNGNYNIKKQKILADKFKQVLEENKMVKEKILSNFSSKCQSEKYQADNVWIYFSAFDTIARIEANENVSRNRILQLKKELEIEELWEISNVFSVAIFFLYTEKQKKYYETREQKKLWADKYFDILEPYNEFCYFKRDKFNIYLDSKENFDNNYKSNWYYYYK